MPSILKIHQKPMVENVKENGIPAQQMEEEIDLLELAHKVWDERKLVLKVCGIATVIGLVVAFSIPKEYASTILIAPESSAGKSGGGLSSLAAMAGFNISTPTADAIYPDLYPEIVSSIPFLTDLFNIPVIMNEEDAKAMPLAEYMLEHQRAPWWNAIISFPFKALGWAMSLFSDDEKSDLEKEIDTFRLTPEESGIAGAINNRIAVNIDKKTNVITLTVTMQDPLIAATLADSVRVRLQKYVTEYRTSKARTTLEFTQKLYDETKAQYNEAQAKYAEFADRNQSLNTQSARIELERLQNEQGLAYGTYSQMAQQLQVAKAKVDEITPVYTILQPASVPLRATKPSKMMILVGFIFLGGVVSVGWILFVKDFLATWKGKKEEKTAISH